MLLPEVDHGEKGVFPLEDGASLVTVGDLRKGGEPLSHVIHPIGRDSPNDHGIAGIAGQLMPDDGAKFPDDALLSKVFGNRQDLFFSQAHLVRNFLKGAPGDGDVPLEPPGDFRLYRCQPPRYGRISLCFCFW